MVVNNPQSSSSVPSIFVENVCTLPNGIEIVGDDYLLVGCNDGIYRINVGNRNKQKVTDESRAIATVDGMFFDEDQEILYVVMKNDQIAAVSSSDHWVSLDVLYIFRAGCESGIPTTATIAQQTLFSACLKNGASPYEIRSMELVNSVVTDGNSVYSDDDGDDDDDDDDDNRIKNLRIAVFVLIAFCLVLIVLVAAGANAMHNISIAKDARKSAALGDGVDGVATNPVHNEL